jgi:hypothetical protein
MVLMTTPVNCAAPSTLQAAAGGDSPPRTIFTVSHQAEPVQVNAIVPTPLYSRSLAP